MRKTLKNCCQRAHVRAAAPCVGWECAGEALGGLTADSGPGSVILGSGSVILVLIMQYYSRISKL